MLTRSARARRPLNRYERRAVWATAILLPGLMSAGFVLGLSVIRLLGIAIGALAFRVAYRRPMANARFLLVWLPLSPVILSTIYAYTPFQADIIRNGTYLRFFLVAALVVAGARNRKREGRPLDALDRLGIGYVGLVIGYGVVAALLIPSRVDIQGRAQGVQSLALFVLVFLGIRWYNPNDRDRERLRRRAYWVVGIVAAIGLYQKIDPDGFQRIMYQRVQIHVYYAQVAGLTASAYSDALAWFWVQPFRVTSLSLSPFEYADLMLTGAVLGIEGLTRSFRPNHAVLTVICSLGVLFSGTRINLVAVLVVMCSAIFLHFHNEAARARFLILWVMFAVALMPMMVSSRLVQGDANSNEGHITEITNGWDTVIANPLGSGPGDDPSLVRRSTNTRATGSGNTILAIGVQVGLLGMGLFLGFLICLLLRLRSGRSPAPPSDLALARLLIIGGLVSTLTHHAWMSSGPGGFAWLLIGLGCPAAAMSVQPSRVSEPSGALASDRQLLPRYASR